MTIRKPDPILIFMIVVAAWLMLAMFTGCSTAKELIDKAEKKDPTAVAEYARQKYPCIDLLKPDTVIVNGDTVIMVECPEMNGPAEYVSRGTDTIYKQGAVRTIRVPVTLPVQTRYITKWFEDSAKIKLAALQIQGLQKDMASLHTQVITITGKRDWYRRWFFYELSLLLILLIITVWKIWKRATTLKIVR